MHYLIFYYLTLFLGVKMSSYINRIRNCIFEALRHSPCTFEEIVRRCHGVYPTQVKQILDSLNLYTTPVSLYLTQKDLIPCSVNTTIDSDVTDLITYKLDNNPVLSCWYYSWNTCQKIASIDLWHDKRILFLGTPRLFEYFVISNKSSYYRLIDLDKVVIKELHQKYESPRVTVEQNDINTITDFNQKYDVVFLDPPWYLESYYSWLTKAFHFVQKNGIIIAPLFPYLLRPTASDERKKLYEFCRKTSKTVLSFPDFMEYDVPTFEKQELIHAGLDILSNWKISDLIIIKDIISEPLDASNYQIDLKYREWIEFEFSSTRWFLHVESNQPRYSIDNHAPLLSIIDNSPYLYSPSRRNPQLKKANLLSSKGHAFYVSDTMYLSRIFDEIKKGDYKKPDFISTLNIDDYSKNILAKIMERR